MVKPTPQPQQLKAQLIPVAQVLLDTSNPRLPEGVQNSSQGTILKYLLETADLEELAKSIVDNGYFSHEPIFVVEGEGSDKGKYIAVEGNRRLATLKMLTRQDVPDELFLSDIDDSAVDVDSLKAVPCVVVKQRDELSAYLGFRHIGGLKPWPSEAKARYIVREVERLVREGHENPFYEIGRRVGSNQQGIRSPYVALKVLRAAKDLFDIDTKFLQDERFGVWLRCMSSSDIRSVIGLSETTTLEDITSSLKRLNEDGLRRVIGDLRPRKSESKPLIADSRQITLYGEVITNPKANEVLKRTGDLARASKALSQDGLAKRIGDLRSECESVTNEITELDSVSEEIRSAANQLFRASRSLVAAAKREDEA